MGEAAMSQRMLVGNAQPQPHRIDIGQHDTGKRQDHKPRGRDVRAQYNGQRQGYGKMGNGRYENC